MLCLVRYLFDISTSVVDCLGRFVPEMTYYVLSGTLNLTKLKLKLVDHQFANDMVQTDCNELFAIYCIVNLWPTI